MVRCSRDVVDDGFDAVSGMNAKIDDRLGVEGMHVRLHADPEDVDVIVVRIAALVRDTSESRDLVTGRQSQRLDSPIR